MLAECLVSTSGGRQLRHSGRSESAVAPPTLATSSTSSTSKVPPVNPVSKRNTSFPSNLATCRLSFRCSQETPVLTQTPNLCVCSWGIYTVLDGIQSAHYFATVPSQVLPQPGAQSARLPQAAAPQLERFHLPIHYSATFSLKMGKKYLCKLNCYFPPIFLR